MLIKTAADFGPIYYKVDLKADTRLSSYIEPVVYAHILGGNDWKTLFTNSAGSAVARALDLVLRTVFDPSRTSRLFKQHLTPDSLVRRAEKQGLSLKWAEAALTLFILAKVGITGYDPTFKIKDKIDIPDTGCYPSLEQLCQMANAKAYLEQDFYPLLLEAMSKANTHVNNGIVSGEGQMRSYFMGTDVPSQIASEFSVIWATAANRAAHGSAKGTYDDVAQSRQLKRAIAMRYMSLSEFHEHYGQWANNMAPIFACSNIVKQIAFKKGHDNITDKDTLEGRSTEELRSVVDSVPALIESSFLAAVRNLSEFIASDNAFLKKTSGVAEVGKLAPFTKLSTQSAVMPSLDARPLDSNPVLAVADINPNLYGQTFLIAQNQTTAVSSLIKDAYNLVVSVYNNIKAAYASADAPFAKRSYLDLQTKEAVASLPDEVVLDAVIDDEDCILDASDRGEVRVRKTFIGDIASTLAQVGYVGFENDYLFVNVKEAFSCVAMSDRFTAVASEPFYGIPLGDDYPYVATIRDQLINDYKLMINVAPDEFKTSIVYPRIKGRKSIFGAELLSKYGIERNTLFLKNYFFTKQEARLRSALEAIWDPATTVSLDVDNIIIGAGMDIVSRAVPLFGDWVSGKFLSQHSKEHNMRATHADQMRQRACVNMSAVRAYIDIVKVFAPDTAAALTWIVKIAGARSSAQFFNLYLEKAAK